MSHYYFKVVCACDGKMTGECDRDPAGIVRIFVEAHTGPTHWIVSRLAVHPLKVTASIAKMRKAARVGLREKQMAASA